MLRVAVVGAGPAGLYATQALQHAAEDGALADGVAVDVIDRLPAPFGLVRHGVAPDHEKIKRVTVALEKVLAHEAVSYLGDVELGRDLTLADLRAGYDAVVVACGAAVDRRLGVPGEDLPGSVSATSFVSWYSGHPDASLPPGLLDATEAVVIGVGNVAVDVARVLLLGTDALRTTDVPHAVLDALAASRVRTVTIIGRRGPVQATWTPKELRELGEVPGIDVDVLASDLELDAASEALVATSKPAARGVAVLQEWAARAPTGAERRLRLRFWLQPVAVLAADDDGPDDNDPDDDGHGHGPVSRVTAVRVARTRPDEAGRAVTTGEETDVPAGLVLRSIGYRGVAVAGLPFDGGAAVVPSEEGRVLADGAPVPGVYVTGWIRRGPTGVIGTNRSDAAAVVASLVADARAGALPAPSGPDAATLLSARGARVPVDLDGWRRLDEAEAALGAGRTAPRVKVADWDGLRAAASPPAAGDARR